MFKEEEVADEMVRPGAASCRSQRLTKSREPNLVEDRDHDPKHGETIREREGGRKRIFTVHYKSSSIKINVALNKI